MGFEQEFRGTGVTKIPNTFWLLEGGDGVEVRAVGICTLIGVGLQNLQVESP